MPSSLAFSLPVLAPGPNVLLRKHWAKRGRLRDAWAWDIRAAAGTATVDTPCAVEIARRYCGRPMDEDNLHGAAKLPLDALVRAGVIPDDSPEHVRLTCTQERVAKRAEQGTTISLRSLNPTD
jgi:hypothetical protein